MKSLVWLALLVLPAVGSSAVELSSPNGQVVLNFQTSEDGRLLYRVAYRGQPIVLESTLGVELQDAPPIAAGFKIVGTKASSHDETWQPVYGERSKVRDHYQQLVVDLQREAKPLSQLTLTFRAYDAGVALRYTVPEADGVAKIRITKESSQFRFAADHTAWPVYSAQGQYAQVPLSQIKPGCERPLTMRVADNVYVALAEARLVDYARMKFRPLTGTPNALVSDLAGPVEATLPLTTPWRVVMVADSPGRLLEQNDLLLNLNDPCAIADPSWIKPGKVIREVTLTTAGGKACVDFAVRHRLEFVEFDAGWYGPENSNDSDARAVNVDPQRSRGPLDLQEVIRYARERGIGIILYVNHRALERQLGEILPLYRQWGVRGVKYGFVNVGSQQWTRWLHEAVRQAAAHQLMVDIHDEYRPTGYSRTYPNLMTQEGIAGDETSPSNPLTLTILFSRMLAGAADNTVCYYDPRVERNASRAYQLAKPVCVYSPWQFLYWYDRPQGSPSRAGGAGGSQGAIGDDPELEFYDHLPTAWDDTRVLHGQIGQYAVIARRHGTEWYVGCMNAGQGRTLAIPLNFLTPECKYQAHIYRDDPSVATRTHVRIERQSVDATTVLQAALSAQGGQAVRIVPEG